MGNHHQVTGMLGKPMEKAGVVIAYHKRQQVIQPSMLRARLQALRLQVKNVRPVDKVT